MPRLILASASPARSATLRSAGVEPLVRVSSVDEDARLAEAAERLGPLEPADAVLVLAHAKALDVAAAWQVADEEDDEEDETEEV